MIKSLYLFHTYYQTRRILEEIQAPLPQDRAWDAINNPYNQRAYEHICIEYGISPHTDWRLKGKNNGLGWVYFNPGHGIKWLERQDFRHVVFTHFDINKLRDGIYDSSYQSFTKPTRQRNGIVTVHIDYIKQDDTDADTAWRRFIINTSDGFTRSGVERLNDSIRVYVWAILGAQSQTRTGILGSGSAFDAQKQFLANVEDAILSPVDLPSAIKRYEDVLQYAGSEVNFVFGTGLYMAPSNMLLRIGRVADDNNEIMIATSNQTLGLNTGLNLPVAPPDVTNDTGEVGLVEPPPLPMPKASTAESPSETLLPEEFVQHAHKDHEDEKTALVVGGIAIGLLTLWLLR